MVVLCGDVMVRLVCRSQGFNTTSFFFCVLVVHACHRRDHACDFSWKLDGKWVCKRKVVREISRLGLLLSQTFSNCWWDFSPGQCLLFAFIQHLCKSLPSRLLDRSRTHICIFHLNLDLHPLALSVYPTIMNYLHCNDCRCWIVNERSVIENALHQSTLLYVNTRVWTGFWRLSPCTVCMAQRLRLCVCVCRDEEKVFVLFARMRKNQALLQL